MAAILYFLPHTCGRKCKRVPSGVPRSKTAQNFGVYRLFGGKGTDCHVAALLAMTWGRVAAL